MAKGLFASLPVYGDEWKVVASREFTDEEKAAVRSAHVVASDYGSSACFLMRSGGKTYIPMSRDSNLSVGDTVDMDKVKVLTLHREGSGDILRIE